MRKKKEPAFNLSIAKDVLGKLPAAKFHGTQITLIDKPEDVDAAVDELMRADIIGFDTETKPSFKRGQSNVVSLLQLSTREHAFLFRLNRIGFGDRLKALLEDESKLKIGLSIHDDFHHLNRLNSFDPKGFIDLQQYVKQFLIADNSLTRIYGILFGQRISKSQRLTNWEAEQLTQAQQIYASLDALACIDVYDYLEAGKFDPHTSQYKVVPLTNSGVPLPEEPKKLTERSVAAAEKKAQTARKKIESQEKKIARFRERILAAGKVMSVCQKSIAVCEKEIAEALAFIDEVRQMREELEALKAPKPVDVGTQRAASAKKTKTVRAKRAASSKKRTVRKKKSDASET